MNAVYNEPVAAIVGRYAAVRSLWSAPVPIDLDEQSRAEIIRAAIERYRRALRRDAGR